MDIDILLKPNIIDFSLVRRQTKEYIQVDHQVKHNTNDMIRTCVDDVLIKEIKQK